MNIDGIPNPISMNWYQRKSRETAIYPPKHAIAYPILGLAGEAGELANKYKKVLRDDNGELTTEKHAALVEELGDVLWYIAQIASDLHVSLSDVAIENIAKLQSRKERGVLGGSGDSR